MYTSIVDISIYGNALMIQAVNITLKPAIED